MSDGLEPGPASPIRSAKTASARGRRAERSAVVTARHVLFPKYPPDPDVSPSPAKLRFYADQGNSYDAKVLGTNDEQHDLAVLTVPPPGGFTWDRQVLAPLSAQSRGTKVWFVGRNETWFVPVQPGAIVNDAPFRDFRIEADGVPIRVGTSGAPLIAIAGIVGMILSDNADDTRALSIDFIKASFRDWVLPWDLQERPASPRRLSGSFRLHAIAGDGNIRRDTRRPVRVRLEHRVTIRERTYTPTSSRLRSAASRGIRTTH